MMRRGELDRDAVLRIAAAVKKRGPGIVRRAHFFQRARPVAIGLAVLAAILFAAEWSRRDEVEIAPVAQIRAPSDSRACASWDDRTAERALDDGGLQLDLGRRALAIASSGSEVRVSSLLPCSTVLALERGRIVVHARDLGGGELLVKAGSDEVVVHGTVFAVKRDGDLLEVEVAEGRVELIAAETIAIAAGERVRKQNGSLERGRLSPSSEQSMLRAVGLSTEEPNPPEPIAPKTKEPRRKKKVKPREEKAAPIETQPVETQPVETPADLMQRAQEARKRGDRDAARELFARAGRDLEAAWISLSRMELDASRPAAAIAALDERQRLFGEGALSIEAAWLRVRALETSGDRRGARTEAAKIVERWPRSPYAEQARRWLEKK